MCLEGFSLSFLGLLYMQYMHLKEQHGVFTASGFVSWSCLRALREGAGVGQEREGRSTVVAEGKGGCG